MPKRSREAQFDWCHRLAEDRPALSEEELAQIEAVAEELRTWHIAQKSSR